MFRTTTSLIKNYSSLRFSSNSVFDFIILKLSLRNFIQSDISFYFYFDTLNNVDLNFGDNLQTTFSYLTIANVFFYLNGIMENKIITNFEENYDLILFS